MSALADETTAVDQRRLQRLAREPSRVFAFSEVRSYRWPVVRVTLDGDDWYGPGHGPWLFRGTPEDKVLTRALDKLGMTRANAAHTATIAALLDAEASVCALGAAVMVELDDKHIVIGHVTDSGILPAVAVAYAERTYGPGQWESLVSYPVFRYRTERGMTTALVSCIDRKVETGGQGVRLDT